MTALITMGKVGDSGNAGIAASTQVIVSGSFEGEAQVEIETEADSLRKAVVHIFKEPGAIIVDAKSGTTLTATVKRGNAATSIDVSAI